MCTSPVWICEVWESCLPSFCWKQLPETSRMGMGGGGDLARVIEWERSFSMAFVSWCYTGVKSKWGVHHFWVNSPIRLK